MKSALGYPATENVEKKDVEDYTTSVAKICHALKGLVIAKKLRVIITIHRTLANE